MNIKLWQSPQDQQWYFHVAARNHDIIVTSEGYTRKVSAERAIASLRKSLPTAKLIEVPDDSHLVAREASDDFVPTGE